MRIKILQRQGSVDSIGKRKTRRDSALNIGKIKKAEKSANNLFDNFLGLMKKPAAFSLIQSGGMKIIALTLIIGLNWFAISAIRGTRAYFNDVETSENNIMEAGRLDFELSSESDFQPKITPEQNSAKTIKIKDYSTMDYNYKARVENSRGGLCDYLYLEDGISGAPQALSAFVSNEVLYSDKREWIFDASMDGGGSGREGQVCRFDFVFEGWQDNVNFGTGGFYDVERISNVISTGDHSPVSLCVKINEVYYDPDSQHGDANDEWIELYNSCDYEVNIKDWYLEDNGGEKYREDLNHNYSIGPRRFVVIAANASTWIYWSNIPDKAFKIALGGKKMFNGLNNDGDEVFLYDNQSNKIDAVSWGTDNSAFEPAAPDVEKGHSIARKIKGVDTDTADDWEDLTNPNPGTNPHSISFSTPVNKESAPAFELATAINSANLAETATAAEEEIFEEEPAIPAMEENVAEEKEPLSEGMPAEKVLVIEEQPIDILNENPSEQNSAPENNGNNKENEDASGSGETSISDDMPIKNDDNSTEIIFSI